MAAIYRYLGDRFRAIAYQKAARMISGLTEDVQSYIRNETLQELPGIGESIAEKITEFVASGKVKQYEELKEKVPHGIMDMMNIRGFGPKSLQKIHRTLKVEKKEDLVRALQEGKVAKLKGFGAKKVEGMLRGLKLHKTVEERMLLWDALEAGREILAWLRQLPEVKQAELAGSLRRKKDTIGDIDVLVACEKKFRRKIVAHFTSPQFASQVTAKGETRAAIIHNASGKQADLRLVDEDEWGSALLYFTGSKEHNIHLRTIGKEKGYKINEYGLFVTKSEKRIAGKTEEELYGKLGLSYIPPEMREDAGEIELAARHKIPALVSMNDIRGDLQLHSTWSDGLSSIEEIAQYVAANFNYEYIVVTDHSRSSRIAHGLDEKDLLKQLKEIAAINRKLGRNFIKTGIEVDILRNGRLDFSDEILEQLDWVTAAIHNNFSADNTDRLIRACEHPLVRCIGHPTGRLIGKREAYKADMNEVIRAAKQTGTALEINAQPDRMDLNDQLAKQAREQGVKLVISTDSHQLSQFGFMEPGVAIARRAWCTPDDILNTRSWEELKRLTRKKSKKELVQQ